MGSTAGPSRSKQDRSVYLPQDFDCNTEARCSTCDNLVNVHRWLEHRKECFITKSQRCDLCASSFNHEVNLEIHKLLKHPTHGKECSICNKTFKRESAFRGHVMSHFVVDKLQCSAVQCKEEFDSLMELNRHRRLQHSDKAAMTEALICSYCGEIFSPIDIDAHKRSHTYERVLQKKIVSTRKKCEKKSSIPVARPHICTICEKAFRRPKELERHLSIHSDTRTFKCAFCPMEFRHENVLQAHIKLHKRTNTVHKCRICNNNFNTRFNLHRHLKMTHMRKESEGTRKNKIVEEVDQLINLNEDILPVELQVEEFSAHELVDYVDADNEDTIEGAAVDDWDSMQMEDEDSGIEQGGERWDLEGVTGCDLAEQLFENRERKQERMIVIPENSIRCPACIHSMESIEHLMDHFKILGSKDSLHQRVSFNCMFCQEDVLGVDVFDHLQGHGMASHSRDLVPVRSIPRPHVCPSCQRSFTKKIDLTRHIRTHTGEKPFECRECRQRFRVETTLRRHEQTHCDTPSSRIGSATEAEMDAAHDCSMCGKGFSTRTALHTHMINHSTPCSLCNQTFKTAAEREEHTVRDHSNREIGIRNRVGGMFLPSIPGGLATLSQISRPMTGGRLGSVGNVSSSAFHVIPSTVKEETQRKVNVLAEDTAKEGMVMKLSRKRINPEAPPSTSNEQHSSSLSFAVPHQLLSSLQMEGGVLRTQLNRGRVVNMHPSETLSALDCTHRMDMHPVESQSLPYPAPQGLRSSSFVPIDINSDNYFVDHCNICDVSFSTKEESSCHMSSEDHETAMLLTPHSGMESSSSQMVCKLCGNRFVSMAPLVEHIRREHERDHPKSLAPLNLHTSHLISSNNH